MIEPVDPTCLSGGLRHSSSRRWQSTGHDIFLRLLKEGAPANVDRSNNFNARLFLDGTSCCTINTSATVLEGYFYRSTAGAPRATSIWQSTAWILCARGLCFPLNLPIRRIASNIYGVRAISPKTPRISIETAYFGENIRLGKHIEEDEAQIQALISARLMKRMTLPSPRRTRRGTFNSVVDGHFCVVSVRDSAR